MAAFGVKASSVDGLRENRGDLVCPQWIVLSFDGQYWAVEDVPGRSGAAPDDAVRPKGNQPRPRGWDGPPAPPAVPSGALPAGAAANAVQSASATRTPNPDAEPEPAPPAWPAGTPASEAPDDFGWTPSPEDDDSEIPF